MDAGHEDEEVAALIKVLRGDSGSINGDTSSIKE